MQKKLKIRKNDIVKVISGNSKGKEGKVLSVDRNTMRAIVEGVNLVSRHTKPNTKSPQGGIIKKESPIHVSNLMLVQGGEVTRVGRKPDEKTGKLVRYSKKTNEVIK
jgi:large subunit ribosomal protein L24